MRRKIRMPCPPPQLRSYFPLRKICGTWVSLCGSPVLVIYHDGKRFRLQFTYKPKESFTLTLRQVRGITFFNFYGRIQISYDDEREMLILSTEGNYQRLYDPCDN